MNKFKRLGWVGVIFFAFFLCVSLHQAQSAEATSSLNCDCGDRRGRG